MPTVQGGPKRGAMSGEVPVYQSQVMAPKNPRLVSEDGDFKKISPSHYMHDMSLTTEEKLAETRDMRLPRIVQLLDMSEQTYQKFSDVHMEQPLFQPFPSEIFFQQFEVGKTYEVPLILRNSDKVARLVKVTQEDSPYFKIISPNNIGDKVAPGMPTKFKIQFTPEEDKDYLHELVCVTEREKFMVPVKALSSRAILDFPDKVNFSLCPVKYPTVRSLHVRNVGYRIAKFSLDTETPYQVTPNKGVLNIGDSKQVDVEFKPTKIGDFNCQLIIHYDTGEDVCVELYGAAGDANVRLDKSSVRVENTFISMTNQRTVSIVNRSDIIVSFKWKQFATLDEESQQRSLFYNELATEESTERDRFLEECITDPSLRDKMSLLTRTFMNRQRLVEDDSMIFQNNIFSIEPAEGDIWPHSELEASVIFKPDEARSYNCTVFCDISGRESRLPLRIKGDGIGPKVLLSYDHLDIGNIFINSKHCYEVVLTNKGAIDAIYSLIEKETKFSSCFNFDPAEGIILPDGHQAVRVSFLANILGSFNETFNIVVDGASEYITFNIEGNVIGPTFHFNVPRLKFGNVSYGFKSSRTVRLKSLAEVPISFHLRIPGDGVSEPVSGLADLNRDRLPKDQGHRGLLKEFTVTPRRAVIPPHGEIDIQVDLLSNTLKRYDCLLVVDVEDVGDELLNLPITAKCIVPTVMLNPPVLDYGRVFIRHPYDQRVKLINETELPTKYELVHQIRTDHELCPLFYSSPSAKGIIEAKSFVEMPIIVSANQLEECECTALITLYGNTDLPLEVQLRCFGEGPVLHVTPTDIDWGLTPVLADITRIIRLSNQSLIAAPFTTKMAHPNSAFRVVPDSGVVPPDEYINLEVIANLDDSIPFVDRIYLKVEDNVTNTILLSAQGTGTTIVSDPPITPGLNLGPRFSNRQFEFVFKLTNIGRRHQQLFWMTDGFPIVRMRPKEPSYDPKDIRFQGKSMSNETRTPMFQLHPSRASLDPGDSVDVTLTGFSKDSGLVKEKILCYAIYGKVTGKECIIETEITADFIQPLIELSTRLLHFRVDVTAETELEIMKQDLTVCNVSSLPLIATLKLESPFCIETTDGDTVTVSQKTEMNIGVNESTTYTIFFNPMYKDDLHTRIADSFLSIDYRDHPHVEYVALRGEVFYPNLQLDTSTLNFGCILNDTEVSRYVTLTNNSPMAVQFQWAFTQPDHPIAIYSCGLTFTDKEQTLDISEDSGNKRETTPDIQIPPCIVEDTELVADDSLSVQQEEQQQEDVDNNGVDNGLTQEQPTDPEQQQQELSDVCSDKEDNNSLHQQQPAEDVQDLHTEYVDTSTTYYVAGIEEVFDIMPLYGVLQPGDSQQIMFTFYGHSEIDTNAKAICSVEGGPEYEVSLCGEASLIEYCFDTKYIDVGQQLFDQILEFEITLHNTSKVGLTFTTQTSEQENSDKLQPGIPFISPANGYVEAFRHQTISIKLLPASPEIFHKTFQVQVSHFEPDVISINGEGVFPRIILDLPRHVDDDGSYKSMMKTAKEILSKEKKTPDDPTNALEGLDFLFKKQIQTKISDEPSDVELQMEVERLIVKEQALDLGSKMVSSGEKKRKKKQKFSLPDYVLDFGYVILGEVVTRVVSATNVGHGSLAFSLDQASLHATGFSVQLDTSFHLATSSDHEIVNFLVAFDPRSAGIDFGDVEAVVPIMISNGPTVSLRLRAKVTMPDLKLSDDYIDFSDVQCGQCKIVTVQLHNYTPVKCEWSSIVADKSTTKKSDKHLPLHIKKKLKPEKGKPKVFEIIPPTGVLVPGQRVNVQVKFMPDEELEYDQRLPIRLSQSSRKVVLGVHGNGLEPQIEFSKNLIEFGPVLPYSAGDEIEVRVKNPGNSTVEIYNLEFDTQYLKEEKILRMMKGYDQFDNLLLPPRGPGESLPQEITQFYEQQINKIEEEEKPKGEENETVTEPGKESEDSGQASTAPAPTTATPTTTTVTVTSSTPADTSKPEAISTGVGELEITPVSAAIARYLDIDLTPEGKKSRNRRGITIIVHGAPKSGKTTTSVALAEVYECCVLTIDDIVLEAIINGNTESGRKAKELCANAGKQKREDDAVAAQLAMEQAAEAAAAATQAALQAPATNRRGSVVGVGKVKDKHQPPQQQQHQPTQPTEQQTDVCRMFDPIWLPVGEQCGGEFGLFTCILPDEILTDIIDSKLQCMDCYKGCVIDGLDNHYSYDLISSGQVVLKAFNNRKYIYFITLNIEESVLKAKQDRAIEDKKRLHEEKVLREKQLLAEITEDQYDLLSDAQRNEIDKRYLAERKKRRERDRERVEKEKKEKEMLALLEQQRLEEERKDKKVKKKGQESGKTAGDKKAPVDKAAGKSASQDKLIAKSDLAVAAKGSGTDRPESRSSALGDDSRKKKSQGGHKKSADMTGELAGEGEEDFDQPPPPTPEEKQLTRRFQLFTHSFKDMKKLIQRWDRSSGSLCRPITPIEAESEDTSVTAPPATGASSSKRGKERVKEKSMDRKDKDDKPKEALTAAAVDSETGVLEEEEKDDLDKEKFGLPHIVIDASEDNTSFSELILSSNELPNIVEIMDGLGLGAEGPPIPPPTVFSVVPYPMKRKQTSADVTATHYLFVAATADDSNLAAEERIMKETDGEQEDGGTIKEDQLSPTRATVKAGRGDKRGESRNTQRRISSPGRKRRSSSIVPGSTAALQLSGGVSTDDDSAESGPLGEVKTPKLSTFKWMIPPQSEVNIRIRFSSEDLGQFDQTMNFEIVGTRRRYQLFCRGVCAFPNISREPRIVFPHRKKMKGSEDIVNKKFILQTETYEFGPLLCGKSRDRYRDGRYPENMENLTVMNTSPLESEVSFCFQNDNQGSTYILHPNTMVLKPNESQELYIWAYPKVPGKFDDSLVCCVRENPEPVIFKVCCLGVRPELELDKKILQFDKVLLHRKSTKTIYLRNSTMLPVAWKLSGLESLGDDFSVNTEAGTIEPKQEFSLNFHFRAMRPVNVKKVIRLEVSDREQIMGLVQAENIQVQAEAYDVALDMSFPKGTDGGVEFGTVRVDEEAKQSISLKNKGKYEIQYSFQLEPSPRTPSELLNYFTIIPQRGSLTASDRPTTVTVVFKSSREVTVKDEAILRCQVIEPNVQDGGETIASIPVKVSARSVFSKYAIIPRSDIDFGAMLVNVRKVCTFMIQNTGEFDYKFTVNRMVKDEPASIKGKSLNKESDNVRSRKSMMPWILARVIACSSKMSKSHDGSSSARSVAKSKRSDSTRQDMSQAVGSATIQGMKLLLGTFTVNPAFGSIPPRGQQLITVESVPEYIGRHEEEIAIDILDRDPDDEPQGIPYRLIADALIPGFNTTDVKSIFEEHVVVKNFSSFSNMYQLRHGGVYSVDQKKFTFGHVIVGKRTSAQFKITNPHKIQCEVTFSLKTTGSGSRSSKTSDLFDISPHRAVIGCHSHEFVTVHFTPASIQAYSAVFEAVVEGLPAQVHKPSPLTFEIVGEGNLPRVTVFKPSLRNKRGSPLLLFQRLLSGCKQSLPFLLRNDGVFQSKILLDLDDSTGSYTITPNSDINVDYIVNDQMDADERKKHTHTMSFTMDIGEQAEFTVTCKPTVVDRCLGLMHLAVIDNQYEQTDIQLVGECYQDDVTIDNAHVANDNDDIDISDDKDDIPAALSNYITFGDCHVGETKHCSFTMTNHCVDSAVRFQWPEHSQLRFVPSVGHLHAGCAKDIQVVFRADEPVTLERTTVECTISKITFTTPVDQVKDWDDRQQVVRWVDVVASRPPTAHTPVKNGKDKLQKDKKGVAVTAAPDPEPSFADKPKPTRRKTIETETEPENIVDEESTRNIELVVTAAVDYAKFKCKLDDIHFKETMMYQTRVYEFQLSNKGTTSLQYSWHVDMIPTITEGNPDNEGDNELCNNNGNMRPQSRLDLSSPVPCLSPDVDLCPFSVEPRSGVVPPGSKKATIKLKFSPVDIGQFHAKLTCRIANKEQNQADPVLLVDGTSQMPYCHFEVEESDYLTGARRDPELKGPGGAPPGTTLDPNMKVIEFNTVGVSKTNIRKFTVLNPTRSVYTYTWSCEDSPTGRKCQVFSCRTVKGTIQPGKTATMIFDFTPETLSLSESFWRFTVSQHNVSLPLLLVGQAREPAVTLDRSHVKFQSVLIGCQAQESVYLVNDEEESYHFSFVGETLHTDGRSASLGVMPMVGMVPPKTRLPIDILFIAAAEREVNFNVLCNVKYKTGPINVNVKAQGFNMNAQLLCEDSSGRQIELASHGLNKISLKEVELNETMVRHLHIVNSGKFNFQYEWLFNDSPLFNNGTIVVEPKTGDIGAGEREKSMITFQPTTKLTVKSCELQLNILNGPKFPIMLEGSSVAPGLHFSFRKHDFGSTFLHRVGSTNVKVKTLTITNKDSKSNSVQCLFTSNSYIEVNCPAKVLNPYESLDVDIRFLPRETKKYKECVKFEVNGLSAVNVDILGQGCEIKVDVQNPKNRTVNFGALNVGHTVKRSVTLVNSSTASITFSLITSALVPELQLHDTLTLTPSTGITLKAKGGTQTIEMKLAPKHRITAFNEEILIDCGPGMTQPVFAVRGQCQDIEISLENNALPFGAVVKKGCSMRRLLMINSGDIGASFKWQVDKFSPDFSIRPVKGYISPGMEIPFEVMFHPTKISQDIRYPNLACLIEGSKPLRLTLTGMCVSCHPQKEIVSFTTSVRVIEKKSVTLTNRSNTDWVLHPTIDGEFYSGDDTIVVPAQQTKYYDITYKPLNMTAEGKKHTGSIFIALPDGTGLLYNLAGISETPKAAGNITRDLPSKTYYTESLTVQNWLKQPQRFKVVVEMIKPEKIDASTTLKGHDYIDVPGLSKREYKLNFYSHREGQYQAKIIFQNVTSQEFSYYFVTFRAGPPGLMSCIELSTASRQSVAHAIHIDNPLNTSVNFQTTCTLPDVMMPPQFAVPPNTEGSFMFEYLPLKSGEATGKIQLTSNELGLYTYDLVLNALPPGPEKAIYFSTSLGKNQTLAAKFVNFAKNKTEYTCKVLQHDRSGEKLDFVVEKSIMAAPGSTGGTEVNVDIVYEPSSLGESRATLTISSPLSGEYVFPLFGTCTAPKPQGPYTIKPNASATILFKNVFHSTTPFSFTIDNPRFTVKASESIRTKKTHSTVVTFEASPNASKAPVMAKMVVSCARTAGTGANVNWIYYLRGITP